MRSTSRVVLIALAGALLFSGCALRDPRDSYAYGRVADGLWDADYDFLIDWNFPTTANQGPLVAPKRFRPERTAIGVPWATGNPLLPRDPAQAPAAEPPGGPSTAATPDIAPEPATDEAPADASAATSDPGAAATRPPRDDRAAAAAPAVAPGRSALPRARSADPGR